MASTQAAIVQTVDAFKVEYKGMGFPGKGTALLCSSRHNIPSLISPDGRYTMFSQALLDVLQNGNSYQNERLSLRLVAHLAEDFLRARFGDGGAPRPEVHSPDQSEGDVADIPFFPNLAIMTSEKINNAPVLPTQEGVNDTTVLTSTASVTPMLQQPLTQHKQVESSQVPNGRLHKQVKTSSQNALMLFLKLRKAIEAIEKTLDTASLREFTEPSIMVIENDLRKIILDIRNIPVEDTQEYIDSKEGVLEQLRQARNYLDRALDQLSESGKRAPGYYDYMGRCQKHLEEALNLWSIPRT